MIRFEDVSKTYVRGHQPALSNVEVEIDRGDFAFLVGASGSGKSTFLRLILREELATSGHVYVAGTSLASISQSGLPRYRRGIGIVFQDFRLLPNKDVFSNVAFAMQVIGRNRATIKETVPNVLEMVGLQEKAKRMPHELSGGEQQRVAIARAIVNKPSILLADEPTGNLDPATSVGIMNIMDRINQNGTTVVMATHDYDIVNSMRRRVIELRDGKIARDERSGEYTSLIQVTRPDGSRELRTTDTMTQKPGQNDAGFIPAFDSEEDEL